MGLTGFNLARRNAEAAQAASLSQPEATAPAVEEAPKRKRRTKTEVKLGEEE